MVSALPTDDTVAGYQQWRDLAFLHWRVPPKELQRLLPQGLVVETFDGSGWLGIVPFSMEKIHPWWSPAVPGISWFLETNVRTYVRGPGGTTGVWFFSLDASTRLAVAVARRFWNLPYEYSVLSRKQSFTIDRTTQTKDRFAQLTYSGRRPEPPHIGYEIRIDLDTGSTPALSAPGSLDQFLLERYTLFAADSAKRLSVGHVSHEPYKFRQAVVLEYQQTLTTPLGINIPGDRPADHSVFCEGVDVTVSHLKCCPA